jgi:hypothetical protein
MNMIRLWGGGQYEKDCFYEICDELGLLVWHDHMFSCAAYPADEAFLSEVEKELAHQLRRLRDHASIALWCGDNECIGALTWFPETKADPYFYKTALMKRHEIQNRMVEKYDPARMFWPSSPCAGPGSFADNWENDAQGDMHNWQVWHANRPFDAYYAYRPRFCSEFGYQSFPSMEVSETFATREQILSRAPEFEWHQKNSGGNRRIRETMLRYFKPPKDVAAELLAAVDTGTPHIAGYSVDGKANGTSAAVRFTAVQLGITELQDFQVSELPPPVFAPEIVIPEGTDAYQAVRMAVLHTYDVSKDAAALRQAPGEFENLRGTYWKRREFHAYTVINAPSGARESLQKLGFNIRE